VQSPGKFLFPIAAAACPCGVLRVARALPIVLLQCFAAVGLPASGFNCSLSFLVVCLVEVEGQSKDQQNGGAQCRHAAAAILF
jgi:hypothetical protein